jgi:hypothetical protein
MAKLKKQITMLKIKWIGFSLVNNNLMVFSGK